MDWSDPFSEGRLDDEVWDVHISSDVHGTISQRIGRSDLRLMHLKDIVQKSGYGKGVQLFVQNGEISGVRALDPLDSQKKLDCVVQMMQTVKVLYVYVMKPPEKPKKVQPHFVEQVAVGTQESVAQCSMDWPSSLNIEVPHGPHMEWPMTNQVDLNMDFEFNSSVDMLKYCNMPQDFINLKEREHVNNVGDQQPSFDLNEPIVMGEDSSGNELDEEIQGVLGEHLEGDTDIDELYPAPPPSTITVDEIPATEAFEATRQGRSKKARLARARAAKQRAAAGSIDDVIDLSDGGIEELRELSDSSDDDGATKNVMKRKSNRKSRAKRPKVRAYYDEARRNPELELHMCFTDVHQFRRALNNYHIVHSRNFEYYRNDSDRIEASCKSNGACSFLIVSSEIKGESTHCIRKLSLPHTCGTTRDSSRISASYLSEHYAEKIRSDLYININSLIDSAKTDFGVKISRHMAYRAKNAALECIEGHENKQYLRIRDYLKTVEVTNPGSRCLATIVYPTEDEIEEAKAIDPTIVLNLRFHGLFFCLNAQVQGFLKGCRPFIDVDGCFLKLGNGAQVLAATSRDGNNNLYPLAFAVVGTEDTYTWTWFLSQLRYALGGVAGKFGKYTIMSDRQKGLLAAVHNVFLDSPHRYCLRHIYANFMIAGHKGENLKKIVDAAAYAFDETNFGLAMEQLKKESQEAWEWLCKIPPNHWARHALDSNCKTDLVVNNISEVFNSYILRLRDKPIVTMIEGIQTKLMARYHSKWDGVEKAKWEITPHYAEKLEWAKKNSRWCTPVCSRRGLWQVSNLDRTYVVNLDERTCGCYQWTMTGLPCKHAVAAIYEAGEQPEDYVSALQKTNVQGSI